MARGKGQKRYTCYCRSCHHNFKACREDAETCSDKCRKAWSRLAGGSDAERAVRHAADDERVYRVFLNGRHVTSKDRREDAETFIESCRSAWPGNFTIRAFRKKPKRSAEV